MMQPVGGMGRSARRSGRKPPDHHLRRRGHPVKRTGPGAGTGAARELARSQDRDRKSLDAQTTVI